jgi:RNA polymerase sigma-70 factor (ECF subfamily)
MASEIAVLEALSSELRPSLLRYFSRKVRDRSHAEDLVQEVFLRLVKKTGFDGNRPGARAYVFETANNVYIDWLRRRRVRQAGAHDSLEPGHPSDEDFSSERVLIGKERLAEALAVLMELPERTRAIFVLRRIEGLRCKDVAKRLNISASSVEKHMVKAVAHLMRHLEDE